MPDIATETQLIPQSAWVQAVFVCLFIVLIIGLLNWMTRREDKWQSFMATQNKEWREWMAEQNKEYVSAVCDMTTALKALRDDIKEHDQKVEEKINASEKFVVGEVKGKPKRKAEAVA